MLSSLLLQKTVADWKTSEGVKAVTVSDITGHFADSVLRDNLIDALSDIDNIIANGVIAKNDAGTLASVVNLSGHPVFMKRVNHRTKKPHHLLRYIVLPSRGYTNQVASLHLAKHGIPTPPVVGVAERRKNGILVHSYIFADPVMDPIEVSDYLSQNISAPPQMHSLLHRLGAFTKKIHDAGVYHGDLKLSNLYFKDGELGVWDLDGIRLFKDHPSRKYIERDLGRAISSFAQSIDNNPALTQTDIAITDIMKAFCEGYEDQDINTDRIFEDIKTYWFKHTTLKHFAVR